MENSFVNLVERLREGKNDAATELVNRYASRLVAVARNRLNARLRQKLDPEDVAQSVFKSFFRRHGREEFTLEDWNGLWGLLVTMTVRKCSRKAEEFATGKRGLDREVGFGGDAESSTTSWEPAGGEPTPEEGAILAETVTEIMESLDERGRQVFEMSLQGYSVPEISEAIGRSERLVYRKLKDIRELLEGAPQGEREASDDE